MAQYVTRVIAARVSRSALPAPFVYRHRGDLATIGRKSAILSLGRLRLKGLLAWLFWSAVHIYFLIGTRHRVTIALTWIWDYITFQRGARLIYEPESRRPNEPLDSRRASA
jgi:NADH dehydrogenase